MKNRKFHIILKSSKQKWKQMQNRYPNTYTDTSIKSDGVKLVLWTQISPLSEMMRPIKCFGQ